MLIDSHAHLTHASLWEQRPSLLKRAQESGVDAIVNICTDPQELQRGLELAKQHSWIFTAAATTPHDVAQEGETAFPLMEEAAKRGSLIAIGETGLDYYHHSGTKEIQKLFLHRYFQLARECNLPIIIHCRDAFPDFLQILDGYDNFPGVLHCFTGTQQDAEQLVKRGWYISFSGIVTFKKSRELQQVAQSIPLTNLLIETDAPYLAPDPYRGKTNEPAYLIETARFLARLRAIPIEELASTTTANAKRFFRLT